MKLGPIHGIGRAVRSSAHALLGRLNIPMPPKMESTSPARVHVLVSNLTGEPQTVSLRGMSGETFDYQVLGEEPKTTVAEISIQLPPYGMARIDRMINE